MVLLNFLKYSASLFKELRDQAIYLVFNLSKS